MSSPGLTNAPLTTSILVAVPSLTLLALALPSPPAVVLALTYNNTTHIFLTVLLIYRLRPLERLWGSRKLAAFLLSVTPYTIALTSLSSPLNKFAVVAQHEDKSRGQVVTALVFALLAQYYSAVPSEWSYAPGLWGEYEAVTVGKKWEIFVLAMGQGSLVAGAVGWGLGWFWRWNILPGAGIVEGIVGLPRAERNR